MNTITAATAAGIMTVIDTGFAPTRVNTRMWIGQLEDGRFTVSSRFQYETVTINRAKAERKFAEMVSP